MATSQVSHTIVINDNLFILCSSKNEILEFKKNARSYN